MTSERTQRLQPNTPTVLVTGATGAVGKPLVELLLKKGYHVRALARNPAAIAIDHPCLELCAADVTRKDSVFSATRGASIVFHLAAKLHEMNPTPQMHSDFLATNIDGTRNVIDAALNAGVERLVHFSTINVYGNLHGTIVDEAHAPRPIGIYAQTKLESEALVTAAHSHTSQQPLGVVLRLAAVYGPNMKGNYLRLARSISRGRFFWIGPSKNRRTVVFENDVARAAFLAATDPNAAGKTYNVTDGELHSLRDIVIAISSALSLSPPKISIPAPFAKAAAAIVDQSLRVLRRPPQMVSMIHKLLEDISVRGALISSEIGFQPLVDLRSGWSQTVQDWKLAGLIA